MPIKVVATRSRDALTAAREIEKKDIQEMVDRNFKHTRKNKKNNPDNDADYKKMDKYVDSRSCWFSMPEIEALLAANGYGVGTGYDPKVNDEEKKKWGIRIYFGYHHEQNAFQPRRENGDIYKEYYHQHTTILVVTETRADETGKIVPELDHLEPGRAVSIVSSDSGLDNGKLCPPSCTGTLIS
ncbi:MAG TPA: hypothetical protein VM187_11615 [Niastella sp.]|nr:hypothetical protein [Niastella sp.]